MRAALRQEYKTAFALESVTADNANYNIGYMGRCQVMYLDAHNGKVMHKDSVPYLTIDVTNQQIIGIAS